MYQYPVVPGDPTTPYLWYGTCWKSAPLTSWSISSTPATIPSTLFSRFTYNRRNCFKSQPNKQSVHLGDGVLLVARMFHQQRDQTNESVEGVETFSSHLEMKSRIIFI